MSFATGD